MNKSKEPKRRSITDYFKRVSSLDETTSSRPLSINAVSNQVHDVCGEEKGDVILESHNLIHSKSNVATISLSGNSSASRKALLLNKKSKASKKVIKKPQSQSYSTSGTQSDHSSVIVTSIFKPLSKQASSFENLVLISSDEEECQQIGSNLVSLPSLTTLNEQKPDALTEDLDEEDSLSSLWMEEDSSLPKPKILKQPEVENMIKEDEIHSDSMSLSEDLNVDLTRFISVEIVEQNLDNSPESDCMTVEEELTEQTDCSNSVRAWGIFRSMIDHVLIDSHFYYLFDEEDWTTLNAFTSLSCPSQQLLVRLMSRKNRWLHRRSIQYEDISSSLDDQLAELCESGFLLNFDFVKDLETVLRLFDLADLKMFARKLNGIGSFNTKEKLVEAIINFSQSHRTLSFAGNASLRNVIMKKARDQLNGQCFRLNKQACRFFYRLFLLHYLPGENDEEIGTLLSIQSYNLQTSPPTPFYQIERERRIYRDREHLIQYELACHFEERIIRAKEGKKSQKLNKLIDEMLSIAKNRFLHVIEKYSDFDKNIPQFSRRFSGGHVLARCLFHLVAILEQRRSYSETFEVLDLLLQQKIYAQAYQAKWFERMILNLEHVRNFTRAAQMCNIAISCHSVPESFKYRFRDKLSKLNRRLNVKDAADSSGFQSKKPKNICTIVGNTIPYKVNDRKNIFYLTDENGEICIVNVEQVVIHHYISGKAEEKFTHGFHCENLFYRTVFAVLFWDLLYTDAPPDAFRYVGQYAPLDLESGEFYQRRSDAIERRLQKLNESNHDQIIQTIENVWTENQNCVSIANFEHMPLEDFCKAVRCLPIKFFAKICSVLAQDYRFTRSGFPDLLLWNEHTGTIRAVEVKGPNDHLSFKQLIWLEKLENFGLRSEVCHVRSARFNDSAHPTDTEQ